MLRYRELNLLRSLNLYLYFPKFCVLVLVQKEALFASEEALEVEHHPAAL